MASERVTAAEGDRSVGTSVNLVFESFFPSSYIPIFSCQVNETSLITDRGTLTSASPTAPDRRLVAASSIYYIFEQLLFFGKKGKAYAVSITMQRDKLRGPGFLFLVKEQGQQKPGNM